jgi:hypothetical protein
MTEIEQMIDEYEQHEQNYIDFEDLRFGDIYLEDEPTVRKIEAKRKQRKMKKEKDYEWR